MTATGQKRTTRFDGSEIAVVGLAGRFPGARSVDALWQNIRNGVESIKFFTDDELLAAGVDRRSLQRADYVKAAAVLEDTEWFDAAFFGFSPRDAEILDPQHRLFLETAWEALESAGYDPGRTDASIGVFAGAGRNTYYENLHSNGEGGIDAILANESDFLATRVAYKLDLKGPSLSIQTSCSTSLVAVHVACQQLLTQQCDIALAGGVYLDRLPVTGYLWQAGSILSSDGHCRAFDARADGAVAGRGVGVVVLKRLDDALRDGDAIRAVIRGSAVNNDGATKVSYAAPSVAGQAEVIAEALAVADVPADSIGLVEAHGTGTALGDPAEIAALTKAYRSQGRGFCAIGSIKSNIGHLDVAAGVAGFIKAVMALEHRELPPTLHFEKPNPDIDLDRSPFFVNTALRPWNAGDTPRRAGVSAFGIGGTNAHVILEEAPPIAPRPPSAAPQLVIVSARTSSALVEAASALANHLQRTPHVELRDVAFTLQTGRRAFEHRAVAVCGSAAEAVAAFGGGLTEGVFRAESIQSASSVLVFPAAGERASALVDELFRDEPWFRESVSVCREAFEQPIGVDAMGGHADATLFALEVALAKRVEQMGLRPSALAGRGVGLVAAAYVGGVVSLEDAVQLVASDRPRQLPVRVPRVPVYADRTGRRIDVRDLLEWRNEASHVHSDELSSLIREDICAVIQVGPGRDAALELRTRSRSAESPVIGMIEGAAESPAGTRVLEGLGRIWAVGCDLDWTPLRAGAPLMRVPLPTYPFERQRFWIDPRPVAAPAPKRVGKIEDLREWFHRPTWTQAAPLAAQNHADIADGRAWLLFMDEQGLGVDLAARLRARGCRVVEAYRAEAFARVDADTFRIDAASEGDYQQLIGACVSASSVWSIVHLWASGESAEPEQHDDVDGALADGFYSVLSLAQALGRDGSNAEWRLHIVTSGVLAVTGEEALRPSRSALIGSCRVIPQELPHVSCALIDVALNAGRAASRQIELLVDELVVAPADYIVAHRGSTRWVQTFDAIRVEPAAVPVRLRDQGVYLITGGTGGMGLALTEYLIDRVQARVVLVSRTGALAEDVRARFGADVLVVKADVTNRADMQRAVEAAVERFGRIDGVVHAAGVAGGGLIPLKTKEAADRVLKPKVHGIYVLADVLRGQKLDFLVLCSSLQALVGGLGQIDYCAANAVLDAYAQAQWAVGNRSVRSIDWDAWEQVGMAVNTPMPEDLRREREESLQRAILPSEGTTVFGCVLSAELPQVAVYAQPFDAIVDAARGRRRSAQPAAVAAHQRRPRHPRPALANPYVAARTRTERCVCEVFEEVLGLEAVGIHDSFFELGGHSLLAVRLMKGVNDALQAQIPVAKLYEGLTVDFLVGIAAPIGDIDSADAGDPDVGEKRRDKARQQREHQQRRRVALGR